jgi:methylthioribose-1-phosphate isomerase
MNLPKSVQWKDNNLVLLDQTKLPLQNHFLTMGNSSDVWNAIKELKVRGAPAIGIAGAYGLYLGLREFAHLDHKNFLQKAQEIHNYLNSSRPTAVNLKWALNRMVTVVLNHPHMTTEKTLQLLLHEAINIHDEDRELCRKIGETAMPLIKDGMGILTHCNAGAIAVSEWGTALAPMYMAHQKGIKFHVYVDETRPLLQGSRLTAWELMQAGISSTLICDNMSATLMAQGKIDMVIVGTDRVVANGDMANKIGTLGVAVLARHFKIPFYVACPTSTFDFQTGTGKDIEIEERSSQEITHIQGVQVAPNGIHVYNPAFDVTPHELISGIITEKGIFPYPYSEKVKMLFA